MNSCSPPASGGEHVVLQQKLKVKMLKQRNCLGSRCIQELVDRSYVLQGVELVDTVSKPCRFARDAFYDRLTKLKMISRTLSERSSLLRCLKHDRSLVRGKLMPSTKSHMLSLTTYIFRTTAGRVKFAVNCDRRRRLQASFELSLTRHC